MTKGYTPAPIALKPTSSQQVASIIENPSVINARCHQVVTAACTNAPHFPCAVFHQPARGVSGETLYCALIFYRR